MYFNISFEREPSSLSCDGRRVLVGGDVWGGTSLRVKREVRLSEE